MSSTDLIQTHQHLIKVLATGSAVDLWTITNPTHPVAMVALGAPTATDEFGSVVVAALAPTVLHAADWIVNALCRDNIAELCPGFVGPLSHAFVFEFRSSSALSVVGWSHLGQLTYGSVTGRANPAFPLDVELSPFVSVPGLLSRSMFNATVLRQLEHLEELFPRVFS